MAETVAAPMALRRELRLDRMIEIARDMDMPLDDVVFYMGRCSETDFRTFSGNPSLLPRNRKSNVKP